MHFHSGRYLNKLQQILFLPLALGNKWQYIKEYRRNGYNTALEDITITKDTIIAINNIFTLDI
jgi:Zn/Cd-binding protein ZinT